MFSLHFTFLQSKFVISLVVLPSKCAATQPKITYNNRISFFITKHFQKLYSSTFYYSICAIIDTTTDHDIMGVCRWRVHPIYCAWFPSSALLCCIQFWKSPILRHWVAKIAVSLLRFEKGKETRQLVLTFFPDK